MENIIGSTKTSLQLIIMLGIYQTQTAKPFW